MPCVTFWRQSSDRVDLDHCSKMIHPPFPGPDISPLSRYAAQERARRPLLPLGRAAVIEAKGAVPQKETPAGGSRGLFEGSIMLLSRDAERDDQQRRRRPVVPNADPQNNWSWTRLKAACRRFFVVPNVHCPVGSRNAT